MDYVGWTMLGFLALVVLAGVVWWIAHGIEEGYGYGMLISAGLIVLAAIVGQILKVVIG